MIKGLGNDILEITRIRAIINKHKRRFLKKFFNPNELNYCLMHKDLVPHLAGRFTAKEAIAKAIGTGFGSSLSFLDIEILNDALGRPYPRFSNRFNEIFETPHIILSISHCKKYASAIALWVS